MRPAIHPGQHPFPTRPCSRRVRARGPIPANSGDALLVLVDAGVPRGNDLRARGGRQSQGKEGQGDENPAHPHTYGSPAERLTGGVRIERAKTRINLAMAPPAESARAARGEIGGLGRFPLIAELADYRERLGPILASTVLPFALVVYLALAGGGYDVVVRSEVGVALWWIVLLGALVGVLPVRPLGRAEQVGLGLLLAFAAWTALGISWSDSSERSVEEVGRVLTFVGVLALSLSAQDREALRRTVRAVGSAIALVGDPCPALAPGALLVPQERGG